MSRRISILVVQGQSAALVHAGRHLHPAEQHWQLLPEFLGRGARSVGPAALSCHWGLQLSCGYSFLYVSTLARPGAQIDRSVNTTCTSLAGASRATTGFGPGPIPFGTPGSAPAASGSPALTFRLQETDFWAQGVDLGVLVVL